MDFRKILQTPVEEIKRPPLIPVGTYRAKVSKPAAFDVAGKDEWDVVDFQLLLLEPVGLTVDQEDLEKYGNLGPHSVVRHNFMFTREDGSEADAARGRTGFNLKRFLAEHLKVEGETINEQIANAHNQECLVTIKWRADKNDPETMYNQVGKTAPIE